MTPPTPPTNFFSDDPEPGSGVEPTSTNSPVLDILDRAIASERGLRVTYPTILEARKLRRALYFARDRVRRQLAKHGQPCPYDNLSFTILATDSGGFAVYVTLAGPVLQTGVVEEL